jgi:hypothetical protein
MRAPKTGSDVDLDKVARLTAGFTGAKTADDYARRLRRWPLHDFRVVWYRDERQAA